MQRLGRGGMRQHHLCRMIRATHVLELVILFSWSRVLSNDEPHHPALFEVTVETTMPHLEENLRYTKTTTTKCMTRSELLVAFPVLSDDAFHECKLTKHSQSDTHAWYRLQCPESTGTTGTASWRFNASHLSGTLEVKLGGKNMRFEQRVRAKRVGDCA